MQSWAAPNRWRRTGHAEAAPEDLGRRFSWQVVRVKQGAPVRRPG